MRLQCTYQEVADRGVAVAHLRLAIAFQTGKGVKRDPAQGLMHLLIASRSFRRPEVQFEKLQAALSTEQIAEVEKAAEAWRPACVN